MSVPASPEDTLMFAEAAESAIVVARQAIGQRAARTALVASLRRAPPRAVVAEGVRAAAPADCSPVAGEDEAIERVPGCLPADLDRPHAGGLEAVH